MNESRNKVERAIEKHLTEAMSNEKPPIGPELAQYLAEWGQWLGDRDGSCRSSDWHVLFLRWSLGGRADEFKQWAERKGTEQTEGALAAIQKVYEFNWPRNLAGHLFGQLWGWLQVELKKPGIPKPLNVREQIESLEKHAKERGQRVKKWHFIGPCVTAVFEEVSEEDAAVRQSQEKEAKEANRASLDNQNEPALPSLSEMDVADAEGFLDEILLCLPVLGVTVFNKPEKTGDQRGKLFLKGKDASAEGCETPEGFLVFSGAKVRIHETPSIHKYMADLRENLTERKLLEQDGKHPHLTQDYSFSSPSTAAAVIMGRNANGRIEWKDSNGKTLKAIQEEGQLT